MKIANCKSVLVLRTATVLLVLLMALPSPAPTTVIFGPKPVVISGGASPTYLVNQNFEGTGYDNSETWTEAGVGTIDEDYTGVVLQGSQSLRVVASAAAPSTFAAFAAQSTCYFYFKMQAASHGSTSAIFSGHPASGSAVRLGVRETTGGALRLEHGTVTADTTDTFANGTTIHVFVSYTKGTGADGVATLGWSTDGTRPTSGNKFVSISTGTSVDDLVRVYVGTRTGTGTYDITFDRVLVDDAQISDNP